MKIELEWAWPDGDTSILEWMKRPENKLIINDRQSYQGKKFLRAIEYCKKFRRAVDVGAHIGLWTYNLSFCFEHVYAFEPVFAHRKCFKTNMKLRTNIALIPCALGDEEGTAKMTEPFASSGDAFITPGADGDIPVKRLDSFGYAYVDFIKIDTEGYELKVLRGAEQTLRDCKPVVIVEQKRDMATKRYDLPMRGAVDFLEGLGATHRADMGGDHILSWD